MSQEKHEFRTSSNATPVIFFEQGSPPAQTFTFGIQRMSTSIPKFQAEIADLTVLHHEDLLAALQKQLDALGGPKLLSMAPNEQENQDVAPELRYCSAKEKKLVKDRRATLELLREEPMMTLKQIAVRVGRSVKFVTDVYKTRRSFEADLFTDYERNRIVKRTRLSDIVESTLKTNHQAVSRDIRLECLQRGVVVGRHTICRKLRATGRKWRLNKSVTRKKPAKIIKQEQVPQLHRICQTVVALHKQPGCTVLWEDEMKFPISQVATKFWGLQNEPVQARPEESENCITAVVICDQHRFRAVQFFAQELKSQDYQFFLMSCVCRFASEGTNKLKIIQDNAPWHQNKEGPAKALLSRLVQSSIPGWPMLNFIESTFSPVRMKYRSSVKGNGLPQRTKNIFQIFDGCNQTSKFAGMFRSYIRSLIKILQETRE